MIYNIESKARELCLWMTEQSHAETGTDPKDCGICKRVEQMLRKAFAEGERRKNEETRNLESKLSELCLELGELRGKYKASQWPGIIEAWKERAESAEAKLSAYERRALEAEERLLAYQKSGYMCGEHGYSSCPDCVAEYRKTEERLATYENVGPEDEQTKQALAWFEDVEPGTSPHAKHLVLSRALRAAWARAEKAEALVRKLAAALTEAQKIECEASCKMMAGFGEIKHRNHCVLYSNALDLVPAELREKP